MSSPPLYHKLLVCASSFHKPKKPSPENPLPKYLHTHDTGSVNLSSVLFTSSIRYRIYGISLFLICPVVWYQSSGRAALTDRSPGKTMVESSGKKEGSSSCVTIKFPKSRSDSIRIEKAVQWGKVHHRGKIHKLARVVSPYKL